MSAIDYLCCKKCRKKIFYDEHQDLLDYLETYHESKGLMCPECSEQLERELADKNKQLAEARTEIEQLKGRNNASVSAHMWLIMRHAFTSGAYKGYAHGTEHKLLEQMFKEWCSKDYPEAAEKEVERLTELERKDALIEQMRRALAVACLYEMSSAHMETIDAALSAAERR